MRTAVLCAITFALGCAGATEEPPLGSGGSVASGGVATSSGGVVGTPTGGTAIGGATGGALSGGVSSGGASAQGGSSRGGNGGSASGGVISSGGALGTGGASSGGAGKNGSSGFSNGGASKGGSSSGAGMSSGGVMVGAGNDGRGGQSSGGTAGNGGSAGSAKGGATATGGSGGCVQNLACKLTAPPSTGDLHQDCVDRINQFLTQCACLPALARRLDGEACADQMAEYDASKNMAHAGFTAKICTPSGSQNSCPGYSSNSQVIGLCMQQMWDEGPPPTSSCTGTCYEEHGHYINMTDKSVTKVACGFFTTSSGKVWAVQNFSR